MKIAWRQPRLNLVQPSLTRRASILTNYPALKRRARIKGRYAANGVNVQTPVAATRQLLLVENQNTQLIGLMMAPVGNGWREGAQVGHCSVASMKSRPLISLTVKTQS